MLYTPTPFRIVKKEDQTRDIALYTLEKSEKKKDFCYNPGEFFLLSIPGIGEAPFSVCSCSEEAVQFNIRGVGDVSNKLLELKEGDNMWLRGPYGNGYPMNDLKGNNLFIIGGGTGVAPLRGLLKYVEQHGQDYKEVHACFGFRTPSEILFKKDMEEWSKKFNVCISVDKAPGNYKGRVCLVTRLVEESGLDNKNRAVFVCGPPIMMKFTVKSLEEMGFSHEQIFLSFERRMKCGVGMCGHCMISGLYVCKDGPVFRYDKVRGLHE